MRINLRECCPTFSREKPEVKNPVGKSLWKTQNKNKDQLLQKMKRGDLIMGSLWVVFQEVRKCLQRRDSEEKESGHKGSKAFHKLN